MARIRTVKPELFQHDGLFDLEEQTGFPCRLVFIGLFTQADRAGRFQWNPRRLKLAILPYDAVNFAGVLDALRKGGFVTRYTHGGIEYGCIPTFGRHQWPNAKEPESVLPAPGDADEIMSGEPSEHAEITTEQDNGEPDTVQTPCEHSADTVLAQHARSHSGRKERNKEKVTEEGKEKEYIAPHGADNGTSIEPFRMAPFGEAWEKQYGGDFAYPKAARALQRLVRKHGADETLRRWLIYLAANDPQYASAAKFAESFGKWTVPRKKSGAVVRPDGWVG